MKTTKSIFALLVMITFVMSSFVMLDGDREKLLTRKWKPTKLEFNGKAENEAKDTDKRMEFKSDGSLWVDNKKEGFWKLTKDEKNIVIHSDEEDEDMMMVIEKLTEKELVMSVTREGETARFFMVSVK